MPSSSDARPLVYLRWSSSSVYSTIAGGQYLYYPRRMYSIATHVDRMFSCVCDCLSGSVCLRSKRNAVKSSRRLALNPRDTWPTWSTRRMTCTPRFFPHALLVTADLVTDSCRPKMWLVACCWMTFCTTLDSLLRRCSCVLVYSVVVKTHVPFGFINFKYRKFISETRQKSAKSRVHCNANFIKHLQINQSDSIA